MGNSTSKTTKTSSIGKRKNSSSKKNRKDTITTDFPSRAQQIVGDSYRDLQHNIQNGIKRLEEQDHPAAQLLDTICSPYLDAKASFYSSDNENDSRTLSEDETSATDLYHTTGSRKGKDKLNHRLDDRSMEGGESYLTNSDYESVDVMNAKLNKNYARESTDEESSEAVPTVHHNSKKQPLASSFAKRCFFTKSGIGGQTQHYEGLTLTGNVVLMLPSSMKLKGCPTICDEDLRRVEQTYPNQFSRLPDELLLSSGWRRISKYCHFSNKAIPDGVPFFHSKQRLHSGGGYYFLLAAAVGMVRPIDVEPLTRDTLVLLETDYPSSCDLAPPLLIQDPTQWTLVNKFCFFSGGPINQEEDVYYEADFDGNPIYMLAFLSPSLTPAELYKLESDHEPLSTVAAVQDVESVYDLTERDFDDLKLYHLGPCRALPDYILQPTAWMKVLPPHFLEARETALIRAQEIESRLYTQLKSSSYQSSQQFSQPRHSHYPIPSASESQSYSNEEELPDEYEPYDSKDYARQVEEEGAFSPSQNEFMLHQDEQHPLSHNHEDVMGNEEANDSIMMNHQPRLVRMDPPEDEPPSLKRIDDIYYHDTTSDDGLSKEDADSDIHQKPNYERSEHELQLDEDFNKSKDLTVNEYHESDDNSFRDYESNGSPTPHLSLDALNNEDSSPPCSMLRVSPRLRANVLPPISPRSLSHNEISAQQSSAKIGEQDVTQRNRFRRASTPSQVFTPSIATKSKSFDHSALSSSVREHEEFAMGQSPSLTSPNTDSESASSTWEAGSDFTGSSVWTDSSPTNVDRSSRRALILQMAKARMKSNKKTEEKKIEDLDLRNDLD